MRQVEPVESIQALAAVANSPLGTQSIYSASSTKTRRRRTRRYNTTRRSCAPSSTQTRSFPRQPEASTAKSSRRSLPHTCVYNAPRPSPKTTGQSTATKSHTGFVRWCQSHGFPGLADFGPDVESRSGALYCQMCDDIVWDPTFEELRLRKMGTGTFFTGALCQDMFPPENGWPLTGMPPPSS